MPLGSSPQQSTWRAFRMSARQTTQTIDSASLPDNLPSELSERSTRRVTRTIHSASLPNDPTVELPKPFFVLLASTDKPECRDGTGEFETHIAVAPLMLARISHADGPPTSHHQPRQRPTISHAGNPSPFSRKLRARVPCGWQKPLRERNDHERFRKQTQRQTRKRPPQPPSTPIATHKEEPWARNTTEESEPTKDS